VLAGLLIAMLPVLTIAMYAHPFADDFSYGNRTVGAWRETGSLLAAAKAAAEGVGEVFQTWQGTFAGVFVMAMHPAVFSESLYGPGLIGVMLAFVTGIFAVLKVGLMDCLRAEKWEYIVIASVMVFLAIEFVPFPQEAFYWYNSAVYYTGFASLSLFLAALLLKAANAEKLSWRTALLCGGGGMISFVIGGGNFPNALTAALMTALFAAYALIKRRKTFWVPLISLACLCAALFISVSAPGNAIRQEALINENLYPMSGLSAILTSFVYAAMFVPLVAGAPEFLAFAALTPLLYRLAARSGFSFSLPGAVTVLLYGAYASSFTPNLYTMSGYGPMRVVDYNYYVFLFFVLVTVLYWCGWAARKSAERRAAMSRQRARFAKRRQKIDVPVPNGQLAVRVISVTAAACFAIVLLVTASGNKDAITSVSAAHSLLNGEAERYRAEHAARLALFASGDKNLRLTPYTAMPHLIYFGDLSGDPADYRNSGEAQWYGLESVALEK
jgi:hypothetical protein